MSLAAEACAKMKWKVSGLNAAKRGIHDGMKDEGYETIVGGTRRVLASRARTNPDWEKLASPILRQDSELVPGTGDA